MIGGILAGAGIVSNIIGGIAGQQAGAGDRAAGQNAVNAAYQQLAAIGLPPDTAKAIIYQQFQQKGILTPELEEHINLGPSKMEGVKGSEEAQKAQMQALQILQQRGTTGLTPEDRAALNQIRQQIATDTKAKQQAIQQQFAARGQGGSGAELIGQLQATQSGANTASQEGDRLAAMASQNALQAIGQAGTLGGQIQQQQFGEQAQKAQAQDVINQFNVQNQVQQQARNVGVKNQAQAANLGTAQQIANANTQQANQELLRQNQATRQHYLDTLGRASTINAAAGGYANQMNNYAQQKSDAAAAPWQAVGAGLTTFGSSTGNAPSSGSQPVTGIQGGQAVNYGPANTMPPGFNQGGDVPDYQGNQVTDYRNGGKVPGKAEVPGDDPRNDTVHAMLSPGEAVIPRSVMKTSFGKKLAKLLEQHHEVMKHAGEDNE